MFKQGPVWDAQPPLQFPHFSLKFYQCYSHDLISQCSAIQSKWGSVILVCKELSESREQDISNRSDVSDSKNAKSTFVKGGVSHTAELSAQVGVTGARLPQAHSCC